MFLLDANRYSRDAGGVTGRLNEMIEKVGGELLVSRLWAEQKLAYPINGQRKGCLLYTSPSPRDATLSRMPSSA